MKPTRIVLGVALCALLVVGAVSLTGCGNKDVAAKVNGQAIKASELDAQLAQLKKQYPQMFAGSDSAGRLLDFKQRLLENLVNQALIEQAAKDKGINVSDADLQKQIDQLKSGFKDESAFEQALKSAGMTLDQLKSQIRNQLITQKLIETQVLVKDGGTAIMGGVYKNTNSTSTTGVPFLAKLPIIGFLFRNKIDKDANDELLIFITPRVLKN